MAARNLLTSDPDAAGALLDQMVGRARRPHRGRAHPGPRARAAGAARGRAAGGARRARRAPPAGRARRRARRSASCRPSRRRRWPPRSTGSPSRRCATSCATPAPPRAGSSSAAQATERWCSRVTDDGVGIPTDVESGVGLQSMRERAEAIGAALIVEQPAPAAAPGSSCGGRRWCRRERAAADHGRRRSSRVPDGAGRAAVVDRRARGRRPGRLAGHRDRRRRSATTSTS